MKKLRFSYLAFLLFAALLISPSCGSSGESARDAERRESADKALQEVFERVNPIGLAAVVVKDGKVVYEGYKGVSDVESGTPLNEENIFRIASISKSFTTAALLTLVEKGMMTLQDDVGEILGIKIRHPNHPDIPITIEMLLTHTSSLSDAQTYGSLDILNPDVNPDWAKSYHDWAPGENYRYCNLAYNTLGAVVEKVSGVRFDKYVVESVIEPMGLTADFNLSTFDRSKFANIYQYKEGEYIKRDAAYTSRFEPIKDQYQFGYSAPVFSPTGGMKISAKGLARWMAMHINYGTDPATGKVIISEEHAKRMQQPLVDRKPGEQYGYALWNTVNLIPGLNMVGHTGGAYGLSSAMFFNPENGVGVVMISNGHIRERGEDGYQVIQGETIRPLYKIYSE